MRIEKFSGVVRNAFGKPLTELRLKDGTLNTVAELKYSTAFEAYGPDKDVKSYVQADWESALTDIKAANKFPTIEEIVAVVNNKEKANQRQKAMTAEVTNAGLQEPTLENDPNLRLKTVYDALYSNIPADVRETDPDAAVASARAEASRILGIAWK